MEVDDIHSPQIPSQLAPLGVEKWKKKKKKKEKKRTGGEMEGKEKVIGAFLKKGPSECKMVF